MGIRNQNEKQAVLLRGRTKKGLRVHIEKQRVADEQYQVTELGKRSMRVNCEGSERESGIVN
jgi:hypothetical protein